jgi:tetrahydromethanopterin S-methyltransferase subunit D
VEACFEDLYDGVVGCAVGIGYTGVVGSVIAVFGHGHWACSVCCQVYKKTRRKDLNGI